MAGVRSRTFNTNAGAYILTHFSLAGSRVIGVARQGMKQDKVSVLATPVNDQFNHIGPRLLFDSSLLFQPGETIWVLYDT